MYSEQDFKMVASFGYDHIRLPFDEEHLWDINGNKKNESFRLLHQAVQWCIQYDLRIILDLHEVRSHSFNDTDNLLWKNIEAQEHFIDMWLRLSGEFSKYPLSMVAYELLNEAVADDPEDWNRLLKITIDSLRKKEPYRKIIIGSNRWQSPDTFNGLTIPENDSNIILSFHFYEPFIFTHYRTHWTEVGKYSGTVKYPGKAIEPEYLDNYEDCLVENLQAYSKDYNKDTLLKSIQEPIRYANKYGLQLYCGEFGCTPAVHRSDRLQWYCDICEIFRENNMAFANWDYKGAFPVFLQSGMPDERLIDIITGISKE